MEKVLRRVRELLYDDPMDRWDTIFAMVYAIVCDIIAIILAFMG